MTKMSRKSQSALKLLLSAIRRDPLEELREGPQHGAFYFYLSLALTGLGGILHEPFVLALGATLFTFVAVAWLWYVFSLIGLEYRRSFSETRAFLGEELTLTLEIHNRKPLPVTWVRVMDIFAVGLPIKETELPVNRGTHLAEFHSHWRPGAFQHLTRRFTVQCVRRGYHRYGPVTLATGDAFGFFRRTVTLDDTAQVLVYPRLYSAAELRLPAKNPFGVRNSDMVLFEDPLRAAGIRAWQPSDSIARIHWKATARHQDLLSRIYEPSEEPQVLLALNVATLEHYWEGLVVELLERVVSVAASLAALCSAARLPVGLIANANWPGSDQPLRLLPGRSPAQLPSILELLATVEGITHWPLEAMLLRDAPRLPWGSTLLVITGVIYPGLLAALLDLRQAGRQVVLFTLTDTPPETDLPGITLYHLPHLIEDLIAPEAM